MHHVYLTEGIIINSYPLKEQDVFVVVLTKDLGLIKAIVTSGRKIESRHRQSVQPFSVGEYAFVNGKGGWRMTNAVIESVITENRELISKVFGVVEKMIPDEDDMEEVYDLIKKFLSHINDYNPEILEVWVVYMLLEILGYVEDLNIDNFEDQILYVESNIKDLISLINRGIKESHL